MAEVPIPRGWPVRDISSLLIADGVFYAAGALEHRGSLRGVIWTSTDGLHWTAADAPDGWQDVFYRSLVETQDGVMAIGSRMTLTSGRGEPWEVLHAGVVWQTSDAREWRLLNEIPGADPRTAITTADGFLIGGGFAPALSNSCWDGCAPGVRIWWSADGREWNPAVADANTDYQFLDIAWNGTVGVALARDSLAASLSWRSPDGRESVNQARAFQQGETVSILVTPSGEFLAVTPRIYRSADGETWTNEPNSAPVLPAAVLPGIGFVGWIHPFEGQRCTPLRTALTGS